MSSGGANGGSSGDGQPSQNEEEDTFICGVVEGITYYN